MKILLLSFVMITACGKNTEPGIKKYQSNLALNEGIDFVGLKSIGLIQGEIEIVDKDIKILFSNELDQQKKTLQFLNSKKNNKGDFLQETSFVNFKSKPLFEDIKSKQHLIKINLNPSSNDLELFIKKADGIETLGDWDPKKEFHLTHSKLVDLIEGRSSLFLKRNLRRSKIYNELSDSEVKRQTYRVQVFSNDENRIYFVKNYITIEEFKFFLGIQNDLQLSSMNHLLSEKPEKKNRWYRNNYHKNEWIFVFTSADSLKKYFLSNYTYQIQKISRSNGKSLNTFNFRKEPERKVFFRISQIVQNQNFFKEEIKKSYFNSSGELVYSKKGAKYNCSEYFRKVDQTHLVQSDIELVLQNLKMISDEIPLTYESLLSELRNMNYDQYHRRWVFELNSTNSQFSIGLNSEQKESYVDIGRYKVKCNKNFTSSPQVYKKQINQEKELSFVLETYIENI